jgi:YVTN family beta-propeller protein
VAITPNGADVYVANSGSNSVSEIATTTNTVINTVTVGTNPYGVAVTPSGADVYVASSGSNSVSEIATATNTVINTITAGNGAFGVAITPSGADVYVTNFNAGTVSEIATATNAVVATSTVGMNPQGVAVTPNGADLYAANYASGTVSEQGELPQAAPTAGSASFGSAFSGQLAVNDSSGSVTYVTSASSPHVSVSASGAITAPAFAPAGTYTVSGTDSDTSGNSNGWTFALTVTQAATATTLSSSGSPSTFGGQVTYTAAVAPAPYGGTVSFGDGQAAITGCGAQPITSGVATCTVSYAATGSHSITAVYSGDSNHLGSSSSAVTQTVAATTPAAVTGLVITPGDGEVRLAFAASVSDGGSPITGYQVSTDDGQSWTRLDTHGSDTLTATVTRLRNGDSYTIEVRAVNAAGAGAVSAALAPIAPVLPKTKIAVPANPLLYSGPARETVAFDRSWAGIAAPAIINLHGRHLKRGQAASLTGFAFDSATLRPAAQANIRRLAQSLRGDHAVTCEGYTDYRGSLDKQQTLSENRATAVCDALRHDGASVTTTAIGHGSSRPVIIGGNRANRVRNRRVVIVVDH